jgi:hypothetical protein
MGKAASGHASAAAALIGAGRSAVELAPVEAAAKLDAGPR